MPRQNIPALVGLAVFPVAAIGAAAFMLATGTLSATVIAGALFVLAVGQFALALMAFHKASRLEDWLWDHHDRLQDLSEKSDAATLRMDGIESQAKQPLGRLDEIMGDIKSLRDGFRGMMQPKPREPEPKIDWTPEEPRFAEAPKPQAQRGGNEHLELLLEPVIELATGSTAHYRALLDLTDDQGHVVRHAELMQKADQGGMRPALDAHLVKQVAPVLRRLRQKNPGVRAFVPIGVSTLCSREDTQRVVANLERDVDIAGGIVFEFRHADLGVLDGAGIENLAKLARLGATMALSQVQVAGLDLASLRQLGVRFLTFPPHAADAGFGPTPAWRDFVQYARAMQFQIIISDIQQPQQATAATQVGRYGYGPFFAPPRKVRADAGLGLQPRRASAA